MQNQYISYGVQGLYRMADYALRLEMTNDTDTIDIKYYASEKPMACQQPLMLMRSVGERFIHGNGSIKPRVFLD